MTLQAFDIVTRFLTLCLILYSRSLVIEGLDCFSCNNVDNLALCMNHITCNSSQSCFMQKTSSTSGSIYTMGCLDNQNCGSTQGAIVGRGLYSTRQDQSCQECCSTYECNDQLCAHNAPSACVDDETLDCAKLHSLLNVCADIQHAKTICPKFCNLCDIVDGNWSPWSDWSVCSQTCEIGVTYRSRTCSNPAPAHGGVDCQGDSTEAKPCTLGKCPVDGQWSLWSTWSDCSVSCDIGTTSRHRTCNNPTPLYGGKACNGETHETKTCILRLCPVDGDWSSWSPWSNCTVTCGTGVVARVRSCSNPAPANGGANCIGKSSEFNTCTQELCPVHGSWTNWFEWEACDAPCDTGIQRRHRTCSNPAPSRCGDYCVGDTMDVRLCNMRKCSVFDCVDASSSGINTITLRDSKQPLQVYCDQNTTKGGWTVIQRRIDGSVNFNRNFHDYEFGFGNISGEFWLGLKYTQELTSYGSTQLRIDLTDSTGRQGYVIVSNFSLSAGPDYILNLGDVYKVNNMHGNNLHNRGLLSDVGNRFATPDRDVATQCATTTQSAGWFGDCRYVNLNGPYVTPGYTDNNVLGKGIIYADFDERRSLKAVQMMIRRTDSCF